MTLNLANAGYLIFAVVFVTLALLQAAAFVRLYRGSATRRPRNVTGEGRPPAPTVARLVADLHALGFERLGESELTVPSTSGMGPFLGREERRTTWVLLDSRDTTVAEVVAVGPMANLSSTLADGSVVETMYPRGEQIADADLWSSKVATNLADAYDAHRVALDGRAESRGQPREVHNIADYLRLDASYRERFAHRVLRRPLIRNALIPTAVAIAVVVLITVWLLASG